MPPTMVGVHLGAGLEPQSSCLYSKGFGLSPLLRPPPSADFFFHPPLTNYRSTKAHLTAQQAAWLPLERLTLQCSR